MPEWWIFSAGDLVALIGSLATAVVAIVAIVVTRLNARDASDNARAVGEADRRHSLGLAREDREQARLKELYDEVATITVWAEWTVNRTMPVFEPGPKPPDPVPEEKLIELNGRVAIHGTDEMLAALVAFGEAQQAFYAKVWERQYALDHPSHDPEAGGSQFVLFREVEDRRKLVRQAARKVEEVARGDLRPRSTL